ncbi:winged helix-turn-helix domain-containing protein [Streptomyces sp. NRRL F-5053]|uniref:winged helix-turn-helix domain-containing protein n=1 Tax=Streptomyces sp. NRRL F-5053 TaxID=1463854 RepID=UPI0004CA1F27|nr:winged helix-turn-helix domain-containing protein [Streptomyces sp. NRRL F-5053]
MERYAPSIRGKALELLDGGATNREVAELLGVPPGTVGWWRHEDRKARGVGFSRPHSCFRCLGVEPDHRAYAYLLGLYLGDGHIVAKPRQHHLSVYCANAWPGLIDEAESTMRTVLPGATTGRRAKKGCFEVKSYSTHWPCLIPQHGSGRKHERRIALEDWQQKIVDEHPWELIRGLIHSDGCRVTNRTTRLVGGQQKHYEYPRYFFSNKSADILRICTSALDRVGVEWKFTYRDGAPFHVSIARRPSVALMDARIGPKR